MLYIDHMPHLLTLPAALSVRVLDVVRRIASNFRRKVRAETIALYKAGILAASCLLALDVNGGNADADLYWPQWRGPLGTGVAPHADPPVEWSESQSIRWKVALPGKGHSTPVIWGDRLFVTTAVPYGEAVKPSYSGALNAHDEAPVTQRHRFVVMALNRSDGEILWERTVRDELPHAGGHSTASLASNSPVTDGEYVFAFFGSYGLYCLTVDGNLMWETDLGQTNTLHGHGEGSSPALYGDTLVINWDHEDKSFVVAFDRRTGEERWNYRPEDLHLHHAAGLVRGDRGDQSHHR